MPSGKSARISWHPGPGRAGHQFFGAGNRALHAFFAGCEVKRGAIRQHQSAALDAHAVGHDQHQFVALDGGDHGQTDAGVARGGFNDGAACFECAGFFGVFHHGQRDAVLDRAPRVAALRLDPHMGICAEQAVDAHMRGVADGVEDVLGFHEGFLSRWSVGAAPSRRMWMDSRRIIATRATLPQKFRALLRYEWIPAGDNHPVKLARPSLVQSPKGSTGGTSGLHRTA